MIKIILRPFVLLGFNHLALCIHKYINVTLLVIYIQRHKAMQPMEFEEQLANSMERLKKKKKKCGGFVANSKFADVLEHTPVSSPRHVVLVQDTQPRSPVSFYFGYLNLVNYSILI